MAFSGFLKFSAEEGHIDVEQRYTHGLSFWSILFGSGSMTSLWMKKTEEKVTRCISLH